MRLLETAVFRRQREKLSDGAEKEALKKAILELSVDGAGEKSLQGHLAGLRYFTYLSAGRQKKLIYRPAADALVLMSFGPWLHGPGS
jgi:hypothetical protein